ncbi:neogenin protein frazzled isoform X2 [Oratosquilla oratoria]|uniref:neogenin protein frazzled isoform X2 n=1 Tax=Oratosquilla oratoria TaxID=337810 RepID=UPI003F75E288
MGERALGVLVLVCLSVGLAPRLCTANKGTSHNVWTDWAGLEFTLEPRDTVVMKGDPASLQCAAQGSPSPAISWRKDNFLIDISLDDRKSIGLNGTLHLDRVQSRDGRRDAGDYQCQASIPGVGTILSTMAKLQVAALPKFDEHPEDLQVFEGERARLACSIKGNPEPTIAWYKNNHPLSLDPSRMTLLPSGSLEIENVAMSDKGQYQCVASSLDKSKKSKEAVLTVQPALALRDPSPPNFIAVPQPIVAKVGETITLDCAANGYPLPTVVWLKDGATIDMAHLDSRFLFLGTTQSLQIFNIEEQDKGTYMCRAENREDSLDASAHVHVQVTPRFVQKPKNTIAYEKEDIELECDVYGRPQPTISWLKDGELIIESEYFQYVNGNNLKILGLVVTDAGMYQCMANNPAGNIQTSCQLKVLQQAGTTESPGNSTPISTLPQEEILSENGSVPVSENSQMPSEPRMLEAVMTSNRFVTLSWREPQMNNALINGYSVYYRQEGSQRERVQNVSASSSSQSFDEYKTQISNLAPGSTYKVRVMAYTVTGLLGPSSPEIVVRTRPDVDLPAAPEDLKVMATSPTSLHVSWEPPENSKTPIRGYTMYYMEVGSAEEHELEVFETQYDLHNLNEYTEYSVWMVARSDNGPGDSTYEVSARTFSDVPTAQPQNVTVEAASSKSLIIRWEPPPTDHQNGVITGYKIRYKKKDKGKGRTKTTDGNRRLYALTGLNKRTTYAVRVSALTVNGSGPATDWILADTFSNDLDENRVPDKPSSLKAQPLANSITVIWKPPESQDVMVRGYTIGWGRGIPDVYSKLVDSKQRHYLIDGLEPNAEYVISLRAYNQMGDGQPIYDQVRTSEPEEDNTASLTPPVGLKALVLTPFTVALQWTDTTLNRNQIVSDDRYYTVRYTTYAQASSSTPRYKYQNSTEVTSLIDNLKPNTVYEFAVKVIKKRRESRWSLVASNTTMEAKPSSPPRDITVVTISNDPTTVVLNWQPPKQPNGQISGYFIFYTTDANGDWVMEEDSGDRMTFTIRGLTPSTLYYYKMQARNNKGFGPFSPVSNFTTLPGVGMMREQRGWFLDESSLIVLIAVSAAGALVFVGSIVAVFVYCRKVKPRRRPTQPLSFHSGSPLNKMSKVEIKPPDLWIHHDQMELKNMDKNDRNESPNPTTIINHSGPEYEPDDKNTTYTSTSTLDRRTPYQSTYLRDQLSEDETDKLLNRRSLKTKPLVIPLDCNKDTVVGGSTSSSVYSDGTLGRPSYSVPQYSSAGPGVYTPTENPYGTNPNSGMGNAGNMPYESLPPPPQSTQPLLGSLAGPTTSLGQYSSLSGEGSNTLGKRKGNPLRSFSVPAPPQSAPTTPQPKHIGAISPFKKLSGSSAPSTSCQVPAQRRVGAVTRVDSLPEHEEISEALLHGYSNEELSQEMANLEGLMKDLSAITAQQFNC